MIWWVCTHGYTKSSVFAEALTISILSAADALDLLATCTGLETLEIERS